MLRAVQRPVFQTVQTVRLGPVFLGPPPNTIYLIRGSGLTGVQKRLARSCFLLYLVISSSKTFEIFYIYTFDIHDNKTLCIIYLLCLLLLLHSNVVLRHSATCVFQSLRSLARSSTSAFDTCARFGNSSSLM